MAIEKFIEESAEAYNYSQRYNINEKGVLMVTITLAEYRDLVTRNAKAEQRTYDSENWQLKQEVERLKKQILAMSAPDLFKED